MTLIDYRTAKALNTAVDHAEAAYYLSKNNHHLHTERVELEARLASRIAATDTLTVAGYSGFERDALAAVAHAEAMMHRYLGPAGWPVDPAEHNGH